MGSVGRVGGLSDGKSGPGDCEINCVEAEPLGHVGQIMYTFHGVGIYVMELRLLWVLAQLPNRDKLPYMGVCRQYIVFTNLL